MGMVADFRSPQPLRADFTHPDPFVVSAYSICRASEHVIVDPIEDSDHRPPDSDPTVKTKLVNVRILGHLLAQTRLLSGYAIATVATGILSCRADPAERDEAVDVEALSALGEVYKNHLLRPFRRFKGPTSNASSDPSSPSPPSCKLTEEEVDQLLAKTPRSPSKSRQLALHRDDFRCIVTRVLDISYARELQAQAPGPLEAQTLECCHIFPASGSTNHEFQGVLKSLGYTNIVNGLATADSKIYSLENTMTMVHVLHDHFARLDLWLEPTEDSHSEQTPHRYRLRTLWLLPHGLADGQAVTFQCHSAHPRLALPDPEYLRIHAACCRVAHLSGVAGLFDELERDLASDPDPATETPEFSRAPYAHLDHLS
uniref:GTP pyrophosphokinase n=1 Tax=Ganoderma boninense TaxID=34458 RepID=A0A5K1JS21_9APHY|nr:GTP pyrophosphokinase [Ganoderma boninense]